MATWFEITDQSEPVHTVSDGTLHSWLRAIEIALWRALAGIFIFSFYRLPYKITVFLLCTAGPAVVRMMRIACLLAVLAAVVFGPAAATLSLRNPWPVRFAIGWAILAAIGGLWGVRYVRRKLRAALAAQSATSYPIAQRVA